MSKPRPVPQQVAIRVVTPEPAQRGEASRLLGLLITDVLTARQVAPPSPAESNSKKARKRNSSG